MVRYLAIIGLVVLLAGCATSPKITNTIRVTVTQQTQEGAQQNPAEISMVFEVLQDQQPSKVTDIRDSINPDTRANVGLNQDSTGGTGLGELIDKVVP